MEDKERIKKEITENTLNILLRYFDSLLLGLDTDKYRITDAERKRKIVAISNFVNYRLKEKIIDESGALWNVLEEIASSDLEDLKTIKGIFLKLMNLNSRRIFTGNYHLKSKEAILISRYAKQKTREENQRRGIGVLARFFSVFR